MQTETELIRSGIVKGSVVEVTSEEEGFKGAWYRAILEGNPSKSRRNKLIVRYLALLKDDGLSPLREHVDVGFIRPLPPNDIVVENFEEGDVVDVSYRDGWWIGVVVKVLENDMYIVYFDNPPDVMELEKKDLRPHLDWIDGKWVRAAKQRMAKSVYKSGETVELRPETEDLCDVWVPAVVVKENEDGTVIVKYKSMSNEDSAESNTIDVDLSNIRPIWLPCADREYDLLEHVDVRMEFGWREGQVIRVLAGKTYTVMFMRTNESFDFNGSDLRPSMKWKDGKWEHGPEREKCQVTEEPCGNKIDDAATNKNSLFKQAEAEVEAPTEYDPPVVQGLQANLGKETEANARKTSSMETLQTTRNHKDSDNDSAVDKCGKTEEGRSINKRYKRRRVRPHEFLSSELCQVDQRASGASGNPEVVNKDSSDVNEDDQSTLAEEKSSSIKTPNGMNNGEKELGNVEPIRNDTAIVLPFVKKSPFWNKIESMDVFKSVPQRPHFNPLLEISENFREGSAIGMMVVFSGLVEKVNNLSLDDLPSTMQSIKDGFLEIEKYGFDITMPLRRINKLMSLQDKHIQGLNKLEEIEKKLEECIYKYRLEADQLQSQAANIDKVVQNVEEEFKNIVKNP